MDVSQELAQAVGLGIFGAVLGDLFKQWFCLALDDGKLEEHGAVEHGVSILLEGEDPFVFTGTYGGPSADGFAGIDATVFVVADDTSQQSVVGGRNVVVGVEQDGGQCGGIDSEYLFVGNLCGEFRIEGVDAFYYEHLLAFQL